nr:PREDICTED: alpha-tocopherol transfer protein-like [Bemisia tabaci]
MGSSGGSGEDLCVHLGDYVLRFEDEPEYEEVYRERALTELRETPELRQQSLQELRQLMQTEPDLYVPLDDESLQLAFLRSCKFYPQNAFERMKQLYRLKTKHPKYFSNLVPSENKNVFSNNLLTVYPNRDQHGRRILLAQLGGKWKPKDVSLVEIMRGIMIIIEAAILEPRTQISGASLMVDVEGLTLQHIWQFTPGFAKMALDWVQDCLPARIKAIHIVNQPYIFNMLFSVFKPFIGEKLRNRIHFHGSDRSSILSHVDAKCLPVQYGGLCDIDLDKGLELWALLSKYEWLYQQTTSYGYKPRDKKGKANSTNNNITAESPVIKTN